jgi:hypothetical protein
MADKTCGQVGFEAYGEHAKWTAYDGKPMPRWDDALRDDIKEKWEVAAKAIAEKAVADFRKNACVQCRNPDYDGICDCGRQV